MSENDQLAITPPEETFRTPLPAVSRGRALRPYLLAIIIFLIVTKIVFLSPSSLDKTPPTSTLAPEELYDNHEGEITLASGIPKDKIPEYSVEQFNYVSSHAGQKQWKLHAEKAFLYHENKLVHARTVTAYLYDPEGKITIVTGKEAKYFMNQRDLEVFGDVVTVFPDGFKTYSEYLRYKPVEKKVEIPVKYAVRGVGEETVNSKISFTSLGLDFAMATSHVILPKQVHFVMTKVSPVTSPSSTPKNGPPINPVGAALHSNSSASSSSGPIGAAIEPDETIIDSDHCVIEKSIQLAQFTMDPKRPLKTRFVHITQPSTYARARRADLNYGDFSKLLQYMSLFDDVLIKETNKNESLRYGTGGKAFFDAHRDIIMLKEFPQVYQDNDTITGDTIIVHRDTDIIEVEHSNAFNQGDSK